MLLQIIKIFFYQGIQKKNKFAKHNIKHTEK